MLMIVLRVLLVRVEGSAIAVPADRRMLQAPMARTALRHLRRGKALHRQRQQQQADPQCSQHGLHIASLVESTNPLRGGLIRCSAPEARDQLQAVDSYRSLVSWG